MGATASLGLAYATSSSHSLGWLVIHAGIARLLSLYTPFATLPASMPTCAHSTCHLPGDSLTYASQLLILRGGLPLVFTDGLLWGVDVHDARFLGEIHEHGG